MEFTAHHLDPQLHGPPLQHQGWPMVGDANELEQRHQIGHVEQQGDWIQLVELNEGLFPFNGHPLTHSLTVTRKLQAAIKGPHGHVAGVDEQDGGTEDGVE